MTVSVQGTGGETVVFQTRKITGDDLETNAALLDLDDIPMPSGVQDSNSATYANFSAFFNDLPTNASLKGPEGPQGPAIDTVSLSQSVDLSTVTMSFTYQKNGQTYNISTTPTFTIPAGPTGQKGDQGDPGTNGANGVDGSDGVSITGVNQPNPTTINFNLSDGTTTSNVTLPGGGGGSGTVTSVAVTGTNGITVSGSPVTVNGTIALSVNASDLKTHLAIDWADVANKPSIPVSGTDFDPVGTDNSTNVTLNTASYDYLSLAGQTITLGQVDWSTDIANKPTIPVSGTDFDPVGTDNSTNVSLVTTSYDYLSLTGQAITLGAIDWSTDIINKPSIPVSGTDFDPVGTDNSTNVSLNTTNYDYLSLAGQAITLGAIDWTTDISNKPTIPVSGTDFDPVGTDNSTDVTLNNSTYDYLTISGQAITVGQVDWTTDIANKPSIPVSGTDFDPVGTDNSTNVSLATVSNNYLSLSGQEITAGIIPYQLGGTGLTALGSAGQVLKVNSAGTALEYATDNTGAASGADPVVMAIALG